MFFFHRCLVSTADSESATPKPSKSENLQAVFLDEVARRLAAGGNEYGDSSLTRPLPDTAAEILEEALDMAGWVFPLWVKLRIRLQGLTLRADEIADAQDVANECPLCDAKPGAPCTAMNGRAMALTHHPRNRLSR